MQYWYSDDSGLHRCCTAEDARAGAQNALDRMSDYADTAGWTVDVDSVGWGHFVGGVAVAIEEALMVDRVDMCRVAECGCDKVHEGDHDYSAEFDYICGYVLAPATPVAESAEERRYLYLVTPFSIERVSGNNAAKLTWTDAAGGTRVAHYGDFASIDFLDGASTSPSELAEAARVPVLRILDEVEHLANVCGDTNWSTRAKEWLALVRAQTTSLTATLWSRNWSSPRETE